MILCSKCGGTPNATGLCRDCGAQVFPSAPIPLPPPIDDRPEGFPVEPKVAGSGRSQFPRGLIVVLIAVVCIPAIALLIYFAVTSGSRTTGVGTSSPSGTPSPAVNSNTSTGVPNFNANIPQSTPTFVPTATPAPQLPASFQRDYQGTMGRGFSLSITLSRSVGSLSGRASTSGAGSSWDQLEGTINDNGNFTLEGYERGGSNITGDYSGSIRGRTVSGTYKSRVNGKVAHFAAQQQN